MKRAADNLNDRPSRLSIFVRRQKRLIRPALLTLVLCAVGAGCVAFAHRLGSDERFAPLRARIVNMLPLRITNITVTGNELTGDDALQDALGVRRGDFILGFSLNAARQRIDALPFVDHSVIERHLPDTIIIHLIERRPFAVWQNHGHFMLIDREGNQVRDQGMTGKDAQAFMQLPLVVGPDANIAAAALMDELSAQPEVRAHVAAAVRVGQRRWNLTLRDGTVVLLPEGEEVPALRRLAQMQQDMRILERPVLSIDMRLPDRLIIREPPHPAGNDNTPPGTAAPSGLPAPDMPWTRPDMANVRRRA
ncbi:cell division protein FtsQ/DivIB [Novacetimonas hansenii]|uniref:Cell division protein FtsQ n=1 Tax=Novacetimonas hansenii TaxID=436 RepID=A0AAW5ESM8_NOVHA|nr:cell division protein FtsQ/DivIB [Novacetimonas hansenii]MBL7235476.1 cell division protein FtsQ/DivIB [Novacetimonas hansenii]MCJ8354827.1 cell division protein FtsQ/DivIB [Novacetimonas hansenii]PYD72752.1 cell division protein FtsQ [Novacetimonas hansenii]QOF96207.1 cell division protein FtsQ/DivIB [Novacetimonas hansenii]WEQ59116.1 cell division protein FtsQ/DivIB [Novacetimonas hansenii]